MDRVTLTHPEMPDRTIDVHARAVKEWLKSGWERLESAAIHVAEKAEGRHVAPPDADPESADHEE
jgi:hypothetical protein